MAYNKVIYKGEVLVDLTQDSVTAETLAVGTTAHDKSGEVIVGIFEGGTKLPELTTPAIASDILNGKEAINANGEKMTGTFTIDSELTVQDSLISQIQTALQGKAGGTSEPILQEKTVTPSTSSQTVTPDSNYDGLSKVTVNAMPTATQATPSISVDSAGKITASATQTAGYVSAGTKSATKQLTTQAAKTITPSTSSQTAVAKNVYTTGAVTVGAIPSTYVKPTTTKSATTYTPTTSNQTIASGTYCSGAQTIKGDANLKAENIAEGVSIFGVTGTHSGGNGGGSTETCTVILRGESPLYGNETVYYMDGSSGYKEEPMPDFNDDKSIIVQKNSILVSSGFWPSPSGSIVRIDEAYSNYSVFFVSGDGDILYV